MELIPKKSNTKRYTELDALRGIAVLSVLLYHYTVAYDIHFKIISSDHFYFLYGVFAVELFFIISGFVIFLTLDHAKKGTDFLVSRFSRLYPAYWVSILLTLIVLAIFPVPTLGHFTLFDIAANFTMFQGFINKHIPLIDQVYWTLKFELTFYIIMYVLYLTGFLKYVVWLCLPWLALSLLSILFNIPGKKYLDVLFILEFAPFFIAGINFYRLKKNNKDILSHVLVVLSFFVELPWVYHIEMFRTSYISVIILFAIFYLIFYLFVFKGLSWLNNKVLIFFGSISYSLYLLHNVIGYSIIYRLKPISDNQLFYIPIAFIIVVLLATLVSFCVEKPALKLIRTWYKKTNSVL